MVPWFYQQGFPSHSLQGNSKQLLSMNKCRNVNTIKSIHIFILLFIFTFIFFLRSSLMKNRGSSTTWTRLGQPYSIPPDLWHQDYIFHLISLSDFMSIAPWFHICIWFLLRILCHCFVEISPFFRCWREMMDPLPEVREDPEVFLRCISLNFYVSLA